MSVTTFTILGYLFLVPLLGVLFNFRIKNASAWATASGGMGIVMIAAGVAGTRVGGVATYGVAGAVMNTGIWNLWYAITTFLALALVGLFFARPYRRLGLSTIGELFEQRYGRNRSGWLTSLCVQTEYFVVNVIEPLLIGVIISNIVGIELVAGILIGSVVIVVATTLSGLRGATLSNIVHCLVMIFGLGLVAVVAAGQLGGWEGVVSKADLALDAEGIDSEGWWSLVGLGWFPILAMFFSATIHTPAASVYVNFASSAKSESVLIPAFLIAGLMAALMISFSAIIGVEALARYGPDSGISGYGSITRIATDTGPFIGGVAIAAVLAALVSSGGPILLAGSTMAVNDWIPASRNYSVVRKLRAYRITSIIYGALAALIACYFGYVVGTAAVLQWLLLGYAMVVPPAIAIAYVFYVKPTTEPAVFWGIASGYGLGLAAWALDQMVWHLEVDITAYITTLVPLAVIPNVSLLMQANRAGFRAAKSNRAILGLISALLLTGAGYCMQVSSGSDTGAKLCGMVAPLAIAGMYFVLAGGTTAKGLAWGLGGSFTASFLTWWLGTDYELFGANAFVYVAACTPIVLIPTLSLLTQGNTQLGERARSFYQRLQTPV